MGSISITFNAENSKVKKKKQTLRVIIIRGYYTGTLKID